LYPRLLGAAWNDLDPAVRRAHAGGAVDHAVGLLQVRHGPGRLRRLILRAAGVPARSLAAEVHVTVSRNGPVERWRRQFGDTSLVSIQRGGPDRLLAERFGLFEIRFRLAPIGGELVFQQVGLALRLGPLHLPLPDLLAPRVAGRAGTAGGSDRTSVAVVVTTPRGGLLFSYRGSVRWGAPRQ
jgi:hypothetical protein